MNENKTIEHAENESRPTNRIWWVILAILTALWITQLYDGVDWDQIALGGFTGMALATWAIEITGNKVPPSWLSPRKRS